MINIYFILVFSSSLFTFESIVCWKNRLSWAVILQSNVSDIEHTHDIYWHDKTYVSNLKRFVPTLHSTHTQHIQAVLLFNVLCARGAARIFVLHKLIVFKLDTQINIKGELISAGIFLEFVTWFFSAQPLTSTHIHIVRYVWLGIASIASTSWAGNLISILFLKRISSHSDRNIV